MYHRLNTHHIAKKHFFIGTVCALATGSLYAEPNALAQKPPAASAPDAPKPLSETLTGMAKAEFEAGKILIGAKDYENAAIKFDKAYELSKDPRILWNVAICQKELRKYTRMRSTIQRMLNDGGALLSEQDKKDAAQIVEAVQSFITPLKIQVNENGADIFIDGEKIGISPLTEPVLVDVGPRKLRVTKQGFKEFSESLTAAGGDEMTRDIQLEKEFHHGRLVIESAEGNRIYLDGKSVGLGRFEGYVKSGGHLLKVSAPGMQTYQSEVVLQDNQTRRLSISLNPLPPDNSKWLWIGGGALMVTAAVVGGFFLFQPEDKSIVGTIQPGQVRLQSWR